MCSTPYCSGQTVALGMDEDDEGPAAITDCPCGASLNITPLTWDQFDYFKEAGGHEIERDSDLLNEGCDGCDRTDGGYTHQWLDVNGDVLISICLRCRQEDKQL